MIERGLLSKPTEIINGDLSISKTFPESITNDAINSKNIRFFFFVFI
jgi:hypothetical protein